MDLYVSFLGLSKLLFFSYQRIFYFKTTILTASGNRTSGKEFRFDANPNHTHMIIYNDTSVNEAKVSEGTAQRIEYNSFRCRVESLLTRSLSYYKRKLLTTQASEISDEDGDFTKLRVENRQIPMVCLMIRGDLNSIDAIESKIRKEIPVIILKGSGAAADIIAFAAEELSEKYTFVSSKSKT
jgi:hypothetical protein